MGLSTVRRLAAAIMKVGESRVRIIDAKKAAEALTRDDVRELIRTGVVAAVAKKGVGRAKAIEKNARKRMGRRGGRGSRKGSKSLGKALWMRKTRAQRGYLASIKKGMGTGGYRKVYRMIKGNAFKDLAALKAFLAEKKLVK